jgi:6-phosphogluconolactonase (cycloisomerase 2 family)
VNSSIQTINGAYVLRSPLMGVRFSVVMLLAIIGFLVAGCGGGTTNSRALGIANSTAGIGNGNVSRASPVYITNINAGSVSAYLIDESSGALQRNASSPFPTGHSTPDSLTFDPTGKFLLVANSTSASTSVFNVNTVTSALVPVPGSPFAAAANEIRLAMHPSGRFVYGLSSTPAQIDGQTFDGATGSLSSLPGFPVSLNSMGAMGLCISPNGSFLYTSNPNTNLINSFQISNNGTLSPLSTTSLSRVSPVFLTFDTSGHFLFAVNTAGAATGGSVSVLSASLSGELAEIPGSPFAAGSLPVSATFSRGVLYVVNQNSGNLSAFAVNNGTGQLTQIKGSPYQVGPRPVSVATAIHGLFLIVTDSAGGGGGSISVFSVGSDGTLSPVTDSPFTPDTPTPDQVAAI